MVCLNYRSVIIALLAASAARADVSFKNQVASILVERCQTCHNPEKNKGAYRMDSFESLMRPGESKKSPIIPAQPRQSHLFQLITTSDEDDRMPAKGERLTPDQISLIEQWIKEGAKFDGADPKALLVTLIPATGHPQAPQKYPRPVPIMALALQPDGQQIAAGGYHEVTLWDPKTGQLTGRIGNIAQRTQRLVYSPDGSILAAASGTPGKSGELKLLDPASKSIIADLDRTNDMLFALAFSSDGSRLACGGADNAIRVYDMKTRKRDLLIEQHADWVLGLVFTPNGEHILSASRDKSARVLDAKTGSVEHAYFGHEEPVYSVTISPDGKTAYSAGKDKKIHAWTIKDSKKIGEMAGFDEEVLQIITGGGFVFACSADKKVRQFSAENRELVRTYPEFQDWVYSLAFDAKNDRLAAGSFGGEVRIWNASDGSLITSFIAAPGYRAEK
ncbi:MAG TPA: c-type cytochrome domain-containing protein [Tepidisphaeraceae bacterium]|jgi:WD40 repeat protein|nr:c-type cytochrome domain-containing protein [Tepidisphaeraceae bacterium]